MRGISFPFRVGIKGGVAMSEDSFFELPHLKEAIQQVILTSKGERPMLPDFGSEVDTGIFEPDSQSSKTMLVFQTKDAIKNHLADRLKLHGVTAQSENSKLIINVSFSSYEFESRGEFIETVKVGEAQ